MKTSLQPEYIVAIGASAGGLEPLQDFISSLNVKKTKNISFLIAQHMSSDYKSMLGQLLSRKTSLGIKEIGHNEKIEPGKIYTIPTAHDFEIDKKLHFRLTKSKEKGPKPSVNKLFKSVAARFGQKCVGILLSGTGNDGSQGMAAIKSSGGITIVQDPETAKYEGMPVAALSTGLVDNVADPKQIGKELWNMINGKKINVTKTQLKKKQPLKGTVSSILLRLEERLGTDFSSYKMSTIKRRLDKRMADKKINNLKDYDALINRQPEELDDLFQYMLIGVTKFFRDPESFKKMKDILNLLVNNKKDGDEIRIWVPACASGEEAYTLAMMLAKTVTSSRKKITINIFATDIDQKILTTARDGKYDKKSVEMIPAEYMNRYFRRKGDKYLVIKEIKNMLLFSRHDITTNPPFLNLDLISCRNLLIYFNQELQNRIIPVLHYALKANGYLFLGKSENIAGFKNLFATVDSRSKIFKKRPGASPVFKFLHPQSFKISKAAKPAEGTEEAKKFSIEEMVKETLLQTFSHPYVIIDEDLEIIELHGEVQHFLKIRAGYPSNNILRLVIEDLQLELRAVTSKAIAQSKPISGRTRKVKINKETVLLKIDVKPLYPTISTHYYMVSFEKVEMDQVRFSDKNKDQKNPVVHELEQELSASKEHMNTLVEEMETSNEELQALNEELQSSNEELQASNEELETSNEELHAANEELEIAYSELETAKEEIEYKNNKIKESENNLKTLINNTLQGFILVGSDYHIITFNKTAASIYKNIFGTQLSVGTSYFDVIPSKSFKEFHDYFNKALKGETIAYKEVKINTKAGTKYIEFNYTPVEKLDHPTSPDYICISFIDRTSQRLAEKERDRLFTLSIDLFTVLQNDGKVIQCNAAWEKILGYSMNDIIGTNIKKYIHPDDYKEVSKRWKSLEPNQSAHVEFRLSHRNKGHQWFSWNMTAGSSGALYCVAHDISQERKDKELLEITNELGKIGGWEYQPETKTFHLADTLCQIFGLREEEDFEWPDMKKIFHNEKNRTVFEQHLEQAAKRKKPFEIELKTRNSRAEETWIHITGKPVIKEKKLLRIIGTLQDISESKQYELELTVAKRKAEKMNELKSTFLANMSHEIRTPLNGILGMGQLIKMEEDKQTMYEYSDRIVHSGKRLLETINGILDLSKIEAQDIELNIEKINLKEIIKSVVKNLTALAEEKNLYIKTHFGRKEVFSTADRNLLRHIFMNLIGNAIKFTYEGGVTISTYYIENGVKNAIVKIEDTGVGMSREFLPKLFDPFTQEKSSNGSFKGTGLGLSLVKQSLDKLNGSISVSSKPKEGTTFVVSLPL